MHRRTLLFDITLRKHRHHFDYWNRPLNMRVCYLDCLKLVLLPSDTHRKPIMSIKAVLLPFVISLMTVPHTLFQKCQMLLCSCVLDLMKKLKPI
jgi:hypothetical protein